MCARSPDTTHSSEIKEKEEMKTVRFGYLKLAAVFAVLAIVLTGFMKTSTATNQTLPAVAAATGADVANEARVISRYADELASYDRQVVEAAKRARLVTADFDPLQRKSDDLKGRLSDVQNSVRELVRKLKAANEWENLDTPPARITDPGLKAVLQENSFKQVLEEASNGLTSRAGEISTPLEDLRKRLTSRYNSGDVRFVRASYEAPSPFGFVSVRCSIQTIKVNIVLKLDGITGSNTLSRETWAACHPGQAYPF
jgi:hypothetical protein